jgi:hypothetical protein
MVAWVVNKARRALMRSSLLAKKGLAVSKSTAALKPDGRSNIEQRLEVGFGLIIHRFWPVPALHKAINAG